MKKLLLLTLFTSLFFTTSLAGASENDNHLELGFYTSPTVVFDDSYEFFSSDSLVLASWGFDARYEVATIAGVIHVLPYISWRAAKDSGYPQMDSKGMDTIIKTNDLQAGLRLRGWFQPWLGVFVQASGGITAIEMEGTMSEESNSALKTKYNADKIKPSLFAMLGLEMRISPVYLEEKGINKFNFGGEIGIGFAKRWKTNFNPSLEGGDEYSLENASTVDFGHFDLSGLTIQAGLTFSFF